MHVITYPGGFEEIIDCEPDSYMLRECKIRPLGLLEVEGWRSKARYSEIVAAMILKKLAEHEPLTKSDISNLECIAKK